MTAAKPSATLPDRQRLADLHHRLERLRHAVVTDAARLRKIHRAHDDTPSLRNFSHYLALRAHDLRPLQERLGECALSSLGRSEAHVMATLDCLLAMLAAVLGLPEPVEQDAPVSFATGKDLLLANRVRLFGPLPRHRPSHILATMPDSVASHPDLASQLIAAGMDCARINCAHDDERVWTAMIRNVRDAAQAAGRECRILMDLAGPKLRTGRIAEADFLRLKGSVTLIPGDPIEPGVLGFPAAMIAALRPGDVLALRDRRGKQRELVIEAITPDGHCRANCERGAEITAETEFRIAAGKHRRAKIRAALRLPPVDIRLFEGDHLLLDRHDRPGMPARAHDMPAHITCGEPAALDQLRPGATVWIDDGKIGAMVERINDDGALLRITDTGPKGRRLRADKGLNFPDSALQLPVLNDKDHRDLDFAARHADLIGLSFAQSCADLETLRDELAKRGAPNLPIIAKIETARGIGNLPEMLLSMVDRHPFGVMIARGDLMVEIGGERMAELQEEILWLCEAAHVPVIWATQVLETLAHDGSLSRPELTDAAASARADCVMLNKGPYLPRALSVLTDIHTRMAGHQDKKNPQLRALSLASRLLTGAGEKGADAVPGKTVQKKPTISAH